VTAILADAGPITFTYDQWARAASAIILPLLVVTLSGRATRRRAAKHMVDHLVSSPPAWVRAIRAAAGDKKGAMYAAVTSSQSKEGQRIWRSLCWLSTPGWSVVVLLTVLAVFALATAQKRLSGDFGSLFIAALLGGVLSTLLLGEPAALRARYGNALYDSLRGALHDRKDGERLARLGVDRDPIVGTDDHVVDARDDALERVIYLLIVRQPNPTLAHGEQSHTAGPARCRLRCCLSRPWRHDPRN
jgi:hypothetical protein